MGVIVTRPTAVDTTVVSGGITYVYDTTRSKWLSINRYQADFSINHRNIKSNRWMAVASGIYSNNVGYRTPEKGTIVTVTLQAKNNTSAEFEIFEDNSVILTVQLFNESEKTVSTDVDFVGGSSLKCFLKPSGDVDYPLVILNYSSRL